MKNDILAFMNEAADHARAIALNYFRKSFSVDIKNDASPVTQADREIEHAFRTLVAARFPNHGLIGEEFGATDAGKEFTWVIDPIDGTKSFAVGRPLFGTVIGLQRNGKPLAGLIDQAFTNERWLAFHENGATFNTSRAIVAEEKPLHLARTFFGAPATFPGEMIRNILDLSEKVRWPHFGCDCYAYGLLAMGSIDLVVERDLKWHDIAGILPIIEEAGGHVQSWSGGPVHEGWDGTVIAAAGPALAEAAQSFLQS